MNKNTILLAEDNHDDEVLTVRALNKQLNNVTVIVARNGVEVMDYLCGTGAHRGRDTAELPKVLLLDLKMPKMDGLETLKRIRATAHTRFLPVVILTSSDEQRDQVESYRLGANSYVRKPVRYDQFIEAAARLGTYWLEINETPLPQRYTVSA
jgi:two-component system, response regulator